MSTKPYNRIVLVGNGFDLAANLDTSYQSFIDSILKDALIKMLRDREFNSDLLFFSLKNINYSQGIEEVIKVVESRSGIDGVKYLSEVANLSFKYNFFNDIIQKIEIDNWVDVEQFYFDKLKELFNVYARRRADKSVLDQIQNLNSCMDALTNELIKFIRNQQDNNPISTLSSNLGAIVEQCIEPLTVDRSRLVSRHCRDEEPENVIFLNFNYTDTVSNLTRYLIGTKGRIHHIHIHGTVNDFANPVIFGYGDDTNGDYRELELFGENELLRKIKSFHYPRTKNYHNLLNFLSSEEYDVFIIGHSCGLSDRTMLKTIFEHANCLAIQNFHYEGEAEDFDKRMQISRHFTDKVLMRERLLPFDERAIIPQDK